MICDLIIEVLSLRSAVRQNYRICSLKNNSPGCPAQDLAPSCPSRSNRSSDLPQTGNKVWFGEVEYVYRKCVHGDEGYGYSLQYSWRRYSRRGPVYTLSSFLYFFQNRARPVAFFAFGSTFFGYALDVSKSMYQIRAPNSERPKMTMNSVITGRPSAWTERSAVGVRIGASHSKAMVNVVGCLVAFEAEKGALSAGKPRNGLYFLEGPAIKRAKGQPAAASRKNES
jgi:hypothetical protein